MTGTYLPKLSDNLFPIMSGTCSPIMRIANPRSTHACDPINSLAKLDGHPVLHVVIIADERRSHAASLAFTGRLGGVFRAVAAELRGVFDVSYHTVKKHTWHSHGRGVRARMSKDE